MAVEKFSAGQSVTRNNHDPPLAAQVDGGFAPALPIPTRWHDVPAMR
jgi:hypothetical protein